LVYSDDFIQMRDFKEIDQELLKKRVRIDRDALDHIFLLEHIDFDDPEEDLEESFKIMQCALIFLLKHVVWDENWIDRIERFMVQNSDKTYGELMLKARSMSDTQEVGETSQSVMYKFQDIIEDAVQKNYEKGITGKYYIHIWVNKEPYADNTLHIYPQCRRTRPSPYQGNDHFLWSVEDGGKVNFEWCIPKKETLTYILKNPGKFDENYVRMLRKFANDTLEKPQDYFVEKRFHCI
jgi:hypothetical protein